LTDWRPESARPTSSSGVTAEARAKNLAKQQSILTQSGVVCKIGEKFNTVSGLPCTSYESGATATPSCIISPTLKVGSKGENVKCLQTKLTGLVADGVFGPKTKAAVIVFQTTNKLVPDGIVGPITSGIINNLIKN
jgi:murein L,D-transpeptidase YcbB/YkuD